MIDALAFCLLSSVTRFGKILPLWQKFTNLWKMFDYFFLLWQIFGMCGSRKTSCDGRLANKKVKISSFVGPKFHWELNKTESLSTVQEVCRNMIEFGGLGSILQNIFVVSDEPLDCVCLYFDEKSSQHCSKSIYQSLLHCHNGSEFGTSLLYLKSSDLITAMF